LNSALWVRSLLIGRSPFQGRYPASEINGGSCPEKPVQLTPWQNGFAESFNRLFRDAFLNTELFATVAKAQALADHWRWEYNNLRPHSALQGRTPLEAAQPAAA